MKKKDREKFWKRLFHTERDCAWRGTEFYDSFEEVIVAHCYKKWLDDDNPRRLRRCKGICKDFEKRI